MRELRWAGVAAWALVRLTVLLGCFALAYYAVDLLLLDDPSLPGVVVWFAGALFLHDLVVFPLYAGGDRILSLLLRALPRTRVPLVNHVRVPVLGAGLSLIMFLPGIIRQGAATTAGATGLDQEPYRERWVWLAAGLVVASAVVWVLRTLVRAARAPRRDAPAVAPGHDDDPDDRPAGEPAGSAQDGAGDEPAGPRAGRR